MIEHLLLGVCDSSLREGSRRPTADWVDEAATANPLA